MNKQLDNPGVSRMAGDTPRSVPTVDEMLLGVSTMLVNLTDEVEAIRKMMGSRKKGDAD